MAQTSVEWLVEQLLQIDWDDPFYVGLLQEAKAMEKEQIEKAYIEGAEMAKEVFKDELKEFIVLPKPNNNEERKANSQSTR